MVDIFILRRKGKEEALVAREAVFDALNEIEDCFNFL